MDESYQQLPPRPSTQDEWTIHAINIHGVFFERWCQKVITDTPNWTVKATNYPVEFPPPNGPWRGRESALDIRADSQRGKQLITLLIECKKNNAEFINWVFFPKQGDRSQRTLSTAYIDNTPKNEGQGGWTSVSGMIMLEGGAWIADEARETRGSYVSRDRQPRDLTKTSNAAVSDAAYQVALASRGIVHEERKFSSALGAAASPPELPWTQQLFFPVIVTTAKLFKCEFDPADVSPTSGEINFAKATLTECSTVVYEYAVPRHLQVVPADLAGVLTSGAIEQFRRMDILVVHSESFGEFLAAFFGRPASD